MWSVDPLVEREEKDRENARERETTTTSPVYGIQRDSGLKPTVVLTDRFVASRFSATHGTKRRGPYPGLGRNTKERVNCRFPSSLPRQITIAIGFTSCVSTCSVAGEDRRPREIRDIQKGPGQGDVGPTGASDPSQHPSWHSIYVSEADTQAAPSAPSPTSASEKHLDVSVPV